MTTININGEIVMKQVLFLLTLFALFFAAFVHQVQTGLYP